MAGSYLAAGWLLLLTACCELAAAATWLAADLPCRLAGCPARYCLTTWLPTRLAGLPSVCLSVCPAGWLSGWLTCLGGWLSWLG